MLLGTVALAAVAAGLSGAASFFCVVVSYKAMLLRERIPLCLRGAFGRGLGMRLLRFFTGLVRRFPAKYDAILRAEANRKKAALAAALAGKDDGGVCFYGSSTFTFWMQLESDMAPLLDGIRCWNAAFGGSCTRHLPEHARELVFAHRPAVVVYFCGTNDLLSGTSSLAVQNFADFVTLARQHLPSVRFVYLEPTVTPFVRWLGNDLVARYVAASKEARQYAARSGGLVEVVASASFMQSEDMYLGDNHHLSREGHANLARLLAPAVQAQLRRSSGAR